VGARARVVSDRAGIRDLVVDGADVYWTTTQVGGTAAEIAKTPWRGGAVSVLDTGHDGFSLAVNAHTVFFSNNLTGDDPLTILTLPKTGGAPLPFFPAGGAPDAGAPRTGPFGPDLLADDDDVYFVGNDGLVRLPIARPVPKVLASSVVNRGNAISATEVFFAGCRGGGGAAAIVDVSKKSNEKATIWSMCVFAADEVDGIIYWIAGFPGVTFVYSARVNGAPRDLGQPVHHADLPDTNGSRIAVVPPFAYVSTAASTLVRVALDGGATTVIEPSGVHPRARLAADDRSLFWVSADERSIWRLRVK
jgi:hypothetical protein